MSYILDALKRADAERGRGAVPGLHTRQMASPALSDSPSTGRRAGLAAAAVVALGGIAAGVWFWQTSARPVQLAAVEPAGAQPAAPAPPLAQPPVLAPVPEPVTAPAPALKPAAPPAAQKTVSKPPPAAAAGVPAPPPKPRPDPVPVAKASPVPAAPAAPSAIPLLSELPDTIRRQLPPLVINGSVYSSNPGQRLLLVNNLVLPQGAQAAPEVTLEEIRPKSSVFSFRGNRFQLAH
ncbi:MAG: general secretion pathway protein GspB [Polaromonas sp.]|nr:general secretion pathway protein GspB [Polaromonas sp.]